MRHVAEVTHSQLEDLYKQIGWPLYRKYGHAYDAFKIAISDGIDKILDGIGDISKEIKEELLRNIQRRLTPQPVKLRSDIELTCFGYDGIDAIKSAIRAGEKLGSEASPLKIKLVAPPLYVMTTTSLEKEQGIILLNSSIKAVKEEILKFKGDLTVKAQPRAVSERDDKELATIMNDAERNNREVSGDDDVEITDDIEAPPEEEEAPAQVS